MTPTTKAELLRTKATTALREHPDPRAITFADAAADTALAAASGVKQQRFLIEVLSAGGAAPWTTEALGGRRGCEPPCECSSRCREATLSFDQLERRLEARGLRFHVDSTGVRTLVLDVPRVLSDGVRFIDGAHADATVARRAAAGRRQLQLVNDAVTWHGTAQWGPEGLRSQGPFSTYDTACSSFGGLVHRLLEVGIVAVGIPTGSRTRWTRLVRSDVAAVLASDGTDSIDAVEIAQLVAWEDVEPDALGVERDV